MCCPVPVSGNLHASPPRRPSRPPPPMSRAEGGTPPFFLTAKFLFFLLSQVPTVDLGRSAVATPRQTAPRVERVLANLGGGRLVATVKRRVKSADVRWRKPFSTARVHGCLRSHPSRSRLCSVHAGAASLPSAARRYACPPPCDSGATAVSAPPHWPGSRARLAQQILLLPS